MSYEDIVLVLSDSQYLRGTVSIAINAQLRKQQRADYYFYQLPFCSTPMPTYNPRVYGIVMLFYLSRVAGKDEAKRVLGCLARKKFMGPILAFPVEDPDEANIRTDPLDRRDYPTLGLYVLDASSQVLDYNSLQAVSFWYSSLSYRILCLIPLQIASISQYFRSGSTVWEGMLLSELLPLIEQSSESNSKLALEE